MEEIIKEIEEFKKGKSKEEVKLIDDLIVYLKNKPKKQTYSSEFPKNSSKCKYCGK